MGFYVGLWTIRIPTIKDQIQSDYFGIGLIMGSFAIGSIIAMVFANSIIRKTSCKIVLLYSGFFQAILWFPIPYIKNLETFMIISFVFGVIYGVFEISFNLYASNVEKRENKSMMSGFHAFWSLGVLLGSIATSLFLELNVSFIINILIYVIILLPLNLVCVFNLKKDHKIYENLNKNIFFIWPIIIFLLVGISIACALTEGSVDSWGALYMRDYIQVSGFNIGIATISFNIFMVIGRLSGDWFRDKVGVYKLIIILFLFNLLSLVILIFFKSIIFAVVGFAILGIGTSCIIPFAYSLAAKVKGVESGVAISIISIFVYGTFMAAPASLGILANNFGVNNIFLPMLLIFLILMIPISIYKNHFEL
tara:strand:+ start:3717 stop:4811 length:1095 start_codon:yes stop_codon:yes gene_type:complete